MADGRLAEDVVVALRKTGQRENQKIRSEERATGNKQHSIHRATSCSCLWIRTLLQLFLSRGFKLPATLDGS